MHDLRTKSQDLEQLVTRTRRRLRWTWLATGAAVLVVAVAGWLIVSAAADMLIALPVAARVVVFAVLCALLAGMLLAAVVWPGVRPLKLTNVAHRIERTVPGIHNRLITVLDLRQRNGSSRTAAPDAPPEFVHRLLEQTRQRLGAFRAEQVADPRPMRRGLLAAVSVVLLGTLMLIVFNQRMPNALARVVRPTADIPPVTSVTLATPGDLQILQGEPAQITATAEHGRVDALTLHLRAAGDGDGQWHKQPMQRAADGSFSFTISQVNTSYDYRVVGGGTWTRTARIEMVQRPMIKSTGAMVHLPAYMGIIEPRPVEQSATQISAPTGSAIALSAAVTGQAVDGQIQLFTAVTDESRRQIDSETVWFDDNLPADAEATGQWHWTSDRAYSGTKSHTTRWRHEPYGFSTRLNPLNVPAGAALFFYVWVDPQAAPKRIVIDVDDAPQARRLVWGQDDAALDDATKAATLVVGALPAAGRWVRLEAPAAALGGEPAAAADDGAAAAQDSDTAAALSSGAAAGPDDGAVAGVKLSGMAFSTDSGRVWFDRVGYLTRRVETVSTTTLKPAGTLPMTLDESTGRWTGRFGVESDGYFSLQFHNASGHASAAMKPMPIVATTDQPPSVLIEKPGKSVTLAASQPVPLVVRAFDDYGVEAVAIRTGDSPQTLKETRWVSRFEDPQTSRLVMTAIDPAAHGLKPGTPLYFAVVVRDRKGQTAQSAPLRLALADPNQPGDATVEKAGTPLDELLAALGKLVESQTDVAAAAAKMLAKLPDDVKSKLNGDDGQPQITAEQLRQLSKAYEDSLTDEQKRNLAAMQQRIAEQNLNMQKMARDLDEASMQASESALSLPFEAEALQAMAEQMRRMAQQGAQLTDEDLALLDRLRKMEKLTPQQQQELAMLRQQLQQMMAAQRALAQNPQDIDAQMQSLLAQLQAQGMMQSLNGLGQHLQGQQQELDELRHQLATLQQQAAAGKTAQLDDASRKENPLDRNALAALDRARDLLRQRFVQTENMPTQPWLPPGRRPQAMPIEQAPLDDAQPPKPDPKAPPAAPRDEPNWWDKPAPAPAPQQPTGQPPVGQQTPRQMLQQHQDNFQQALTQNSQAAQSTDGELGQMLAQMRSLSQQMAKSQPSESARAGQQLSQMMNSPQMQAMMRMAQRAARQQLAQMMAQQSGQTSDQSQQSATPSSDPKEHQLVPGRVLNGELGGLDLNGQGAAIYRLPPNVRQPLLEGMKERGPQGYQRFIDAYFRQLSQDAK